MKENERKKERQQMSAGKWREGERETCYRMFFQATFKWILCKLLRTPRENVNFPHFQQMIKV